MAPPFIACTDIGMSPCPVMKMIGDLAVGGGELALKIKATLPGQSDVEHQAGRSHPADRTRETQKWTQTAEHPDRAIATDAQPRREGLHRRQ